MSADSPRRTSYDNSRAGTCVPAMVSPQVVTDRSILESAIGFINEVTMAPPHTDPKDTITWARFETAADISDLRYGEDWELDGNVAPPLLLILGYGSGIQVWAIPANGEAVEVLSWRHGQVTALRILPTPSLSITTEDHGRADELVDAFTEKRPLMAVVDSNLSSGAQPQFCAVNFISLKTSAQVKTIKFKNPVIDILANRSSIVITFHERIAIFDARTLEDRLSITTCYPSPGINPNPVALGPRWLAYAEHKLLPSKRSSGGCDGESVASYKATVLNAAKSLGKGLRELGEQVAAGLTGTTSSVSSSKSSSFDSSTTGDSKQAGVVTVIDIKNPLRDFSPTSGVPISSNQGVGNDPIIVHFIAHFEAIVAMEFDNSGMLLLTADRRGHQFNVFRIQPHPVGPSLGAVHHLYVLHRGDTTAKVQNIAFSLDSRWAAVSTLRGTTHVFPITPYGGPVGTRTHSSLHVVNKLSRFHRSAGLTADGRSNSPISHSESTTFTQCLQPYHNPTLPPFPRPTLSTPLAQLRQPFALGSPPGSASLSGPSKSTPSGSGSGSQRQRLPSLSDDNGKPLSVCAIFAKSRSWLLDPPNVTREASHRVQRKSVDSLFVMAGHGALIQYDLDTRLASTVAKEKVSDETPIELIVEAKAQWNLGRRREGSHEIRPPLASDNWLMKNRNSCMLTDSTRQYDDIDEGGDSWLSQVEIVTHAGPHRRLWMGPQFVFKTYNTPSGSNLSLVDTEAVEIGLSKSNTAAATAGAAALSTRHERSSPLNMPLTAPNRSSGVPVLIESGSYSSIEQSPKLMDRFRHDHLNSDFSLTHGETRLKQDLADAMRESPSGSSTQKEGSNCLSADTASTVADNVPFYDALADHEEADDQDYIIARNASAAALATALPNIHSYKAQLDYELLMDKKSKASIEKIVNPLGTVTTVTSCLSVDIKTDILDEVVSQLAAEEAVIHENCDESLFRPVVAIFCDEKRQKLNLEETEEEERKNQELCKPPEVIGNKLIVPVIAKEVDEELSKKEKQKTLAAKTRKMFPKESPIRQRDHSNFEELSGLNKKKWSPALEKEPKDNIIKKESNNIREGSETKQLRKEYTVEEKNVKKQEKQENTEKVVKSLKQKTEERRGQEIQLMEKVEIKRQPEIKAEKLEVNLDENESEQVSKIEVNVRNNIVLKPSLKDTDTIKDYCDKKKETELCIGKCTQNEATFQPADKKDIGDKENPPQLPETAISHMETISTQPQTAANTKLYITEKTAIKEKQPTNSPNEKMEKSQDQSPMTKRSLIKTGQVCAQSLVDSLIDIDEIKKQSVKENLEKAVVAPFGVSIESAKKTKKNKKRNCKSSGSSSEAEDVIEVKKLLRKKKSSSESSDCYTDLVDNPLERKQQAMEDNAMFLSFMKTEERKKDNENRDKLDKKDNSSDEKETQKTEEQNHLGKNTEKMKEISDRKNKQKGTMKEISQSKGKHEEKGAERINCNEDKQTKMRGSASKGEVKDDMKEPELTETCIKPEYGENVEKSDNQQKKNEDFLMTRCVQDYKENEIQNKQDKKDTDKDTRLAKEKDERKIKETIQNKNKELKQPTSIQTVDEAKQSDTHLKQEKIEKIDISASIDIKKREEINIIAAKSTKNDDLKQTMQGRINMKTVETKTSQTTAHECKIIEKKNTLDEEIREAETKPISNEPITCDESYKEAMKSNDKAVRQTFEKSKASNENEKQQNQQVKKEDSKILELERVDKTKDKSMSYKKNGEKSEKTTNIKGIEPTVKETAAGLPSSPKKKEVAKAEITTPSSPKKKGKDNAKPVATTIKPNDPKFSLQATKKTEITECKKELLYSNPSKTGDIKIIGGKNTNTGEVTKSLEVIKTAASVDSPPQSAWKSLSGAEIITKNLSRQDDPKYPSLGTISRAAKTSNVEKLLPELPTPKDVKESFSTSKSNVRKSKKPLPEYEEFHSLKLLEPLPPLPSLEPLELIVDNKTTCIKEISLINFESPVQENPAVERKITPPARNFTEQNLIYALCGSLHYENEQQVRNSPEKPDISPTMSSTRSSSALEEASMADYKSLTENEDPYMSLEQSSQETTTTNTNTTNEKCSSSAHSSGSEEMIAVEGEKKLTKKQKRKKQQQQQQSEKEQEKQNVLRGEDDEELRPLIAMTESQIEQLPRSAQNMETALLDDSFTLNPVTAHNLGQSTTDSEEPMPTTTSDDNVFTMPAPTTHKIKTKKLERKFNLMTAIEAATSSSTSSAEESGVEIGGMERSPEHDDSLIAINTTTISGMTPLTLLAAQNFQLKSTDHIDETDGENRNQFEQKLQTDLTESSPRNRTENFNLDNTALMQESTHNTSSFYELNKQSHGFVDITSTIVNLDIFDDQLSTSSLSNASRFSSEATPLSTTTPPISLSDVIDKNLMHFAVSPNKKSSIKIDDSAVNSTATRTSELVDDINNGCATISLTEDDNSDNNSGTL
uniref:BCAS3 domain-containing protein n=1 Tax=Glossina austeni TaxID=7395 RepID=A0A1A9UHI6_GLOAU